MAPGFGGRNSGVVRSILAVATLVLLIVSQVLAQKSFVATTDGAHSLPSTLTQDVDVEGDGTAWSSFAGRNLTSSQAFHEALELLRAVIDPTAVANAATLGSHGDSSSDSWQSPSTAAVERDTPATTKQRSTFSEVSPYLAFLTSWGPFGTAMRLSNRIQYSLSAYCGKAASLLGRPRRSPSSKSHSNRRKHSTAPRGGARKWAGEQPTMLWPEWEHSNGQLALHGPFLLEQRRETPDTHSNSIDLSWLLDRVSVHTTLSRRRTSSGRREREKAAAKVTEALALLNYSAYPPAGQRSSADALWVLAQHHILGTHGAEPQPWRAQSHLQHLVDHAHPGNSSARSLLGWIEGSRELWKAWGAQLPSELYAGEAQSMSLLHHTFAAREGEYGSMMALAYRHHAGIGTPVDCDEALKWYNRAATSAWVRYKDGPVGGLTVPYTHLRLTDLAGGAYGPGASAASTGWEAYRPAVQAALHSLKGSGVQTGKSSGEPSKLNDLLEYYAYHAQGGSLVNAVRLARIYYSGSIYGISESAGRVQRDFTKVRELSRKVADHVWPIEVASLRMVDGKRVSRVPVGRSSAGAVDTATTLDADFALKVEPSDMMTAGAAAALLGRMYLRGEGVEVDYHKAWMWFWRGVDVADRDCLYGQGLMRSLGLAPDQIAQAAATKATSLGKKQSVARGTPDWKGAVDSWEKAIRAGGPAGHAEASAALGKVHFDMGDIVSAAKHFAHSVTWGSPFEGHYLLAMVNANTYKNSVASLSSTDGSDDVRCHAAAVHFKQAAERGDWESPLFHRGMRAWELGDSRRALVYWSMAAERGDEAAENNIAWALDRDKRMWKLPALDGQEASVSDHVGLIYWTRSAAQGNVDAMVKMGDYYYRGLGVVDSDKDSIPHWPLNVTSRLAQHVPATGISRPSYEKAMACYAAAADKQVSALAYWNMGFLYEEGLGVPRRDFHLAKRYYDMALTTNTEAYLPVMLSLVRLHVKALWATVWKREESAVALFSSYRNGPTELAGYTEAEEEALRSQGTDHGRDGMQGDPGADAEFFGGGDMNLPESYDLRRRQQAQGQQKQPHQMQDSSAHRHARANDRQDGAGQAGSGGNPNAGSGGSGMHLMSLSDDEADAMIEGAMIVIGLSALAMLVYARQAALARAEQERRDQEERRVQEGADDPSRNGVDRRLEPGGSRYAGGLPWPADAAGPQMGL
ncbi:unnamed protein product [Parajaminaea phylloscopi]